MTTDPLFMKDGDDYYFYQNDHLGTPQKIIATNGAVVWSAKYSSFGKAIVDPSSTIINNLRFPGQYYDSETGLHYNYHRYYDVKLGIYLRADPTGLDGGSNVYLYSLANPIGLIDMYGLDVKKSSKMKSKTPNQAVMTGLECMSDCLKTTIWITSGKRPPDLNKQVGGEEESYHLDGIAADIYKLTPTEEKVRKAAALCGFFVWKGSYPQHIHIDLRSGRKPKVKADECECEKLRNE